MMEKPTQNTRALTGKLDAVERKDLSIEETSELLFYSFYYSQGIPRLQKCIFAYIAQEHPEWKIPDSTKEEAFAFAAERNRRMVESGPHKRQPEEKIQRENRRQFDNLCSALNQGFIELNGKEEGQGEEGVLNVPVDDFPIVDMLAGIISRDLKFANEGGRPNRPDSVAERFRPHISHFVDYVLLGKTAPGPVVFRVMMADLRAVVDDLESYLGVDAEKARNDMRALVAVYKDAHPKEVIDVLGYFNPK